MLALGCKQFLDSLVQPDDNIIAIIFRICRFKLKESEIHGEVIYWIIQYLIEKRCPPKLFAPIIRNIVNEILKECTKSHCSSEENEKYYDSTQLQSITVSTLRTYCHRLLDNVELNKILPSASDEVDGSVPYDMPKHVVSCTKNRRRLMEDRHVCIDEFNAVYNIQTPKKASFYGVFDGHGGYHAATYSSSQLSCNLAKDKSYLTNPEEALRNAFLETDVAFSNKNINSGTTAVCALHHPNDNRLYVGWVGDSKAMLAREGTIYQIVNPHKPESLVEKTRIENAGGAIMFSNGHHRVNGILSLTRAIGDISYKPFIISDPDIAVLNLNNKEDFLVLGSDGLWDHVTEKKVAEIVYDHLNDDDWDNLDLITKHLTHLAKEGASQDNITIIIVLLKHRSKIFKPTEIMESPTFDSFNVTEKKDLTEECSNNANTEFNLCWNKTEIKQEHTTDDAFNEQKYQYNDDSNIFLQPMTDNKHLNDNDEQLNFSNQNNSTSYTSTENNGQTIEENLLLNNITDNDFIAKELNSNELLSPISGETPLSQGNEEIKQNLALLTDDGDFGPETSVDVMLPLEKDNSIDTTDLLDNSLLSQSKETLPLSDECNSFDNKNNLIFDAVPMETNVSSPSVEINSESNDFEDELNFQEKSVDKLEIDFNTNAENNDSQNISEECNEYLYTKTTESASDMFQPNDLPTNCTEHNKLEKEESDLIKSNEKLPEIDLADINVHAIEGSLLRSNEELLEINSTEIIADVKDNFEESHLITSSEVLPNIDFNTFNAAEENIKDILEPVNSELVEDKCMIISNEQEIHPTTDPIEELSESKEHEIISNIIAATLEREKTPISELRDNDILQLEQEHQAENQCENKNFEENMEINTEEDSKPVDLLLENNAQQTHESCDESDEEWNYMKVKETQPEKNIEEFKENVEPITSTLKSLTLDLDTKTIQESDGNFKNSPLGNDENNEDIIMNSPLNPDAKEFVPTFSPASSPNEDKEKAPRPNPRHVLDDVVSQSPRKGRESNMDDVLIPEENDFDVEIAKRPHELLVSDVNSPENGQGDTVVEETNPFETEKINVTSGEGDDKNIVEVEITDELIIQKTLENADMKQSLYIENTSSFNDDIDLLNTIQPIPNEDVEEVKSPLDVLSNKEGLSLHFDEKDILSPSGEEVKDIIPSTLPSADIMEPVCDVVKAEKVSESFVEEGNELTKICEAVAEKDNLLTKMSEVFDKNEKSDKIISEEKVTTEPTVSIDNANAITDKIGEEISQAMAVEAKNLKNISEKPVATEISKVLKKPEIQKVASKSTTASVGAKKPIVKSKVGTNVSTAPTRPKTAPVPPSRTSRPASTPTVGLAKPKPRLNENLIKKTTTLSTTARPKLPDTSKLSDIKKPTTLVTKTSTAPRVPMVTATKPRPVSATTNGLTKPRPTTISQKTTTLSAPKLIQNPKISPRSTVASTLRKSEAIKSPTKLAPKPASSRIDTGLKMNGTAAKSTTTTARTTKPTLTTANKLSTGATSTTTAAVANQRKSSPLLKKKPPQTLTTTSTTTTRKSILNKSTTPSKVKTSTTVTTTTTTSDDGLITTTNAMGNSEKIIINDSLQTTNPASSMSTAGILDIEAV